MIKDLKRFIRVFLFNDVADTVEVKKSVTFDKDVTVSGTLTASGVLPGDLALANTKILVGNVSNVAAPVNLSGDATIINTGAITIEAGAITPVKMGKRTTVALSDQNATLNIVQLLTNSIFTITPSTGRILTTPTAAAMVSGIIGATVGSWFDFTIVNTAPFIVTLTAGDGDVTLVGNAVINKGSATFRVLVTNITTGALSIYRMSSGSTVADMALGSGKVLIGQSTGLAAQETLEGDVTVGTDGVTAIGANKVVTAMILDANVTAAKLANGAGLAALFAAGLGGSGSWVKTDTGVKTIHTGTTGTKKVFIICTVTEAFTGAEDQTTFKIGQVGTDDKFAATSLFTDAAINTVKVVCGELTASTNLIVTVAPRANAGTGALAVAAIILPATT